MTMDNNEFPSMVSGTLTIERTCIWCQENFTTRRGDGRAYCTVSCVEEHRNDDMLTGAVIAEVETMAAIGRLREQFANVELLHYGYVAVEDGEMLPPGCVEQVDGISSAEWETYVSSAAEWIGKERRIYSED
jgi:hypothetical protein